MICYWGTICTPLYKSLFQRYKFLKAIHNIDDKFKEYTATFFEKNHFFFLRGNRQMSIFASSSQNRTHIENKRTH